MKIRCIGLMALACVLLITTSVSAQGQFPRLSGGVADQTGRLSGPDVQAAIDRLARQAGAKPLALAYDGKSGLTSDEFEMRFLETNGFGRPRRNLDARVIMIAIDYQNPGIKIWYGDAFTKALDGSVQDIAENSIKPLAGRDPTLAFVTGFEQTGKAIAAYNQRSAPIPQVVTVERNTIDTTGIGKVDWEIFLAILLVVLLLGLGWVFITILKPAYQKRIEILDQIAWYRQELPTLFTELVSRLGSAPQENRALLSLLIAASPQGATRLRQQHQETWSLLLDIKQRMQEYARESVNLLKNPYQLQKILDKYIELDGQCQTAVDWLDALDKQAQQKENSREEVVTQKIN